jgi:hypothetical protein
MPGLPEDEDDIFSAGNEPAPQEVSTPEPTVAPDQESQAVSSAIRGLQNTPARLTPTPPPARSPQDPQPTPGQEQSPAGLLKALLDERDRRQRAETRAERYERQEAEAKARETQTPFDQRFFEKPEQELSTFVDQRFQPYEDRLRNMQADFDMRLARITHGEVFDEAFQAWFAGVGDRANPNPQLYWGVMNSPSPGEAIMQWFTGMRDRQEIGEGGLAAYRERVRQEVLQELGIAAPAVAGTAPVADRQPNGQFAPRHEVRLPTATSRLSSPGRGIRSGEAEDGSEEAIFDAGRGKR